MAAYDLIIRGGTVVDPSRGLHEPLDIAVADRRIAALLPPGAAGEAAEIVDAAGRLITPGLIDLHTHAFPAGSDFGVDPDLYALPRGVTTVLDCGSAGAISRPAFEADVAGRATRVAAMVNLSAIGMPADGELLRLDWADADRAAAVVAEHRDRFRGVKVRLSPLVVGPNAREIFARARRAAERAEAPLMVHPNAAEMDMDEILAGLRAGDILTHCFNTSAQSVLDADGAVRPAARDARKRGVRFDVGHGLGSFSFDVAERALAQGFAPDTISSDLHALNVDTLVYDLPHVLSKFLALGLGLGEVVAAATQRPAETLGLGEEIGALRVGAPADIALFTLDEGEFTFFDRFGATRVGRRRLTPWATLRAGRLYTA